MSALLPEFSRIITVSRLSPQGTEEQLEARATERQALVKRFDLIDLPLLTAHITLVPGRQQTVIATGTIKAEVVQRCVATLEPITEHIDLDVNVVFVPDEQRDDPAAPLSDELEDEFEFFAGGRIDLGEMVAQQLGVNIDFYPRKADAEPIVAEYGAKADDAHPFARLSEVIKLNKNKGETKD